VGSICVQQRVYSVQGEDGCAGIAASLIEDGAGPHASCVRILTYNGYYIVIHIISIASTLTLVGKGFMNFQNHIIQTNNIIIHPILVPKNNNRVCVCLLSIVYIEQNVVVSACRIKNLNRLFRTTNVSV